MEAFKRLGTELIDKTGKPNEIMAWIDGQLLELSQSGDEDKIVKVGETLLQYVNVLEERYNRKGAYPGIESGIEKLDKALLGFQPSRLYYIGARPSQGKSALMITLSLNMILKGRRVGIISIESSCQEILDRLFSQRTGIASELLMTGFFCESDMAKVQDAADYFTTRDLYIYDSPNCDITTLRSRAKRMVAVNQIEILFIDYLQIIEHDDRDIPFREKIAAISKTLKQIARETKIPVVCCAQLRRDAEERRPILSDFSESSQIEKDADAALLLWHEVEAGEEKSWILVEKNRDGARGAIPVYFRRNIYRFDARGQG
jgi:replicative DNA helicase